MWFVRRIPGGFGVGVEVPKLCQNSSQEAPNSLLVSTQLPNRLWTRHEAISEPKWKTPKRSWFQHIKCVETKSEFEDFRGPCGGPKTDISLIDYLAVALDGSRSLEIETIDKEVFRQQLEPGSFYVSSPSSFWDTVEPVIPDAGQSEGQTSLVVRSAV